MLTLTLLVGLLPSAFAASSQAFVAPSTSPFVASSNYVGVSNSTLPAPTIVKGQAFDRFIQIWLENTDFATASSSSTFQTLAKQGILLSNYFSTTHPSQPNYVAAAGGDFFGLADDNLHNIPANVSTIVDLLEAKSISWASYQENLPSNTFTGLNFASKNYVSGSGTYTYYYRKHSPTVSYLSVQNVPKRLALHRNFNDYVADLAANTLPQWLFVTPNIVNDAHDTTIDYTSSWLNYWLVPMLANANFNNNRTLILLTFDENSSSSINNQVYSLLLGGAIPASSKGTTDSTYYTHYSTLSTVQSNWGLGCLGRQDTNKTVSNVFSLVASKTGYKNTNVTTIPLTNKSGTIKGPLNPSNLGPWTAPNTAAVCAGGGSVFV
ncbi:hypothetical protein M422DRAFT_36531 [Sphaerobolus stellatus SS14]|uniref:Acid phosphatase n=1 Tax=Sphaerobolus stellatus (strain SS14) TaxID=990650 RepID=A0A0C9UYP5_SPHS4|nr:hypothetical protein M422DRAFT_36531 [Sphaerobolus stellatus SS14]